MFHNILILMSGVVGVLSLVFLSIVMVQSARVLQLRCGCPDSPGRSAKPAGRKRHRGKKSPHDADRTMATGTKLG
jgi:hypothetical protein